MFYKAPKVFKGWEKKIDSEKGIKNLESIIKHSGLSGSEQYQVKKKILANIEKIQKTTGRELNVNDFEKKVLPDLLKSKIIKKEQFDNISSLVKSRHFPKKEVKFEKAEKIYEIKKVSKFKEKPKAPEVKKPFGEPGSHEWLEAVRKKFSVERDAEFGGMPGGKNSYTAEATELGGRKLNGANGRETQNPAPERREGFSGNIPKRESFNEPPSHSENTGPIMPPSEVGK